MKPIPDCDELRRDAQPISRLADTALEDMIDAQPLADGLYIGVLALEVERRRTRSDVQPPHLRECIQDFLGDAIAEIFLFRIGAHIDERQDGDGLTVGLY